MIPVPIQLEGLSVPFTDNQVIIAYLAQWLIHLEVERQSTGDLLPDPGPLCSAVTAVCSVSSTFKLTII